MFAPWNVAKDYTLRNERNKTTTSETSNLEIKNNNSLMVFLYLHDISTEQVRMSYQCYAL